MICFYHLRLNLASIASVDLYRPYGPYGSWFLDLLVLLCLETQLAFVPNLDFGVSLTMHGIDEMPWKVFLCVATWALKTIEYFRTIKGGAWRCTRCTTQDKSHVHRGTSLNTATGAMCTHWEQFTCTLAADPGAKITGAGSNWQCFHWHGPYVPSILQSSLLFVDVTVWMIVNGLHHVYIYSLYSYIYIFVIYLIYIYTYKINYFVVIVASVVLFPIFDVWKHVERFEKGPVSGASSPAPELELTAKRCKRVPCQSRSEK